MKKRIAKLLALALAASSVFGVSAAAKAANGCLDAPSLKTVARQTAITSVPSGTSAGYYSFNSGVANSSVFPTRVSYATSTLDKMVIDASVSALGRTTSQYSLANQRTGTAAYMNADFFNTGNAMPYSAIIHDGKLVYSPPKKTGVLALAEGSSIEPTGYAVPSTLKSGVNTFTISGVNMPSIPANGLMAYTTKKSGSSVPRGNFAILVVSKKVRAVYTSGTGKRPASGVLIQATGSAATRLAKLRVGAAVTYSVPKAPTYKLVADMVTPNGYVQTNSAKIGITAVNYNGIVESGAILYDANYATTVSQWIGAKTLLLDATGKVVSFYSSGRNITPTSSYPFVLQISSAAYKTLTGTMPAKGMQFTLKNSFLSSGKYTLIAGVGRGNFMMTGGVNKEVCTASSEQIRPRSVIGWNQYGQFWFLTSTMGQDYNDGGYRQGGSTLHQMADWLKELGATEAVPFDGGGSTTMFVDQSGVKTRIDLPSEAWLRDGPVGISMVPLG